MEDRYRVLLVDDEPIIVRSLKAAIPWETYGMDVVGEANSGEDALAIVEERKPHLILSDIRMPMMDGIALMKEVMSADASALFIILSGYGEFAYAREAIRHGAFDYLLKPIDHDELEAVIREAKMKLDAERTQRSEREYLRKSVQSLSSLVRERLLADMIEGMSMPSDRLYWLQEWELEYPYQMVLVALDDYDALLREWSVDEKKLWQFAVRNILQEFGDQRQCLTIFSLHSGEWVLMFQNIGAQELADSASSMVQLIKQCTKLSCSAAISGKHVGIGSLHGAYQEAQFELLKRFVHGKGRVYHSMPAKHDMERGQDVGAPSLESAAADRTGQADWRSIEKRLMQAVQTLDAGRFEIALRELETRFVQIGCAKEEAVEKLFEWSVVLHRQLESMSLRPIDGKDALLRQLPVCGTLSEMTDFVQRRFTEWMKQAAEAETEETGLQLMAKATDYIAGRYHHDLGIDEVAEFIGLSCSHFCVLFKRETGYTFLEYLTKLRIEKACSILRHSDVKVYQVAPLVGYQDPRYFTQVFKKMTGKTPTEYRTAVSEGNPENNAEVIQP